WQIEKGFTREIIALLPNPKPHYNTVSTVLKVLHEKGYVKVENIGKSNFYTPLIDKNTYRKKSMNQYVHQYFSGSYSGMISFFAKEDNISIQDLEAILSELKNAQ